MPHGLVYSLSGCGGGPNGVGVSPAFKFLIILVLFIVLFVTMESFLVFVGFSTGRYWKVLLVPAVGLSPVFFFESVASTYRPLIIVTENIVIEDNLS